MLLRITLIITFCLAQFVGQCQSPADWWYFGNNAGIHFTPSGPVAVGDGQIQTQEGCSSISDQQGNLLFYTDGQLVYDKLHVLMPNGSGLLGATSSAHSSVVIPRPGSSTEFYIFTVDQGGAPGVGIHYSKVDLALNGGNGDVVVNEKNVFLADTASEKLAAVKKPGGFWIIGQKVGTNQFYTFEVTSAGVNTSPIVSNTDWVVSSPYGTMAINSAGDKIAAVDKQDSILIYDFNSVTGLVSSDYKIGSTMPSNPMYGLEFSSDAKILYMASESSEDIRQFDLTLANSIAISASETMIGNNGQGGGQLQMGPDGRIYCARINQTFLSAITEPNVLGVGCNWIDTAVVLTSNSQFGLPTFIQSFFNASFSFSEICSGDSTVFFIDTAGVDSANWNFGDPASGVENTSTLFSPTHLFTDTGEYTVTLIAYSDTIIDTVVQTVFIYPRLSKNWESDFRLCEGDTVNLGLGQPYVTYLWSTGSTSDSIQVYNDSLVTVTVFGVCDTLTDTIEVIVDVPNPIDLGEDVTLCLPNTITLQNLLNPTTDILWSTGVISDSLLITKSGTYSAQDSSACGLFVDTIIVELIPQIDFDPLPPDTINCFDAQIILERPVNDSVTYIWSDSTSGPRFEVDSTQQVWLAAFNECGFVVDTMNILFNGEIKTELGEDTNICDLDSIQLSGSDSTATYFWSTGDTTISIYTEVGLDENYIVTIFKGECAKVESKRVRSSDIFCESIDCDVEFGNVFSPNGDGLNDLFRITSDCDVYSFDMSIYNRWGQLVNYSRNVAYGWNGFINGEPAAEGVYYFVVEYKDFVVVDADRQLTRGSFTLTR